MSLLIFGQTGQVARELAHLVPQARRLGREEADLTDAEACARAIHSARPFAVINAAAYTAVDRAETDEATALAVNALAPAAMARACAELGIPFVHLSSDYVFDGSGTAAHRVGEATGPLNAYGRSKEAGEAAIRAAGCVHAILRTSWVFSAHGTNFVKTMLRLGAQREVLTVVDDQIGGPTPARAIAAACVTMAERLRAEPALSGTQHFAGAPDISWAGFASAIMQAAGLACRIDPIPSAAYPTPARRPMNSRLDCEGLADFGLSRPDWRQGLNEVLAELGALNP